MELNELSSRIIKAAISVHKALGPGLLESVYQSAMVIELNHLDISAQPEVALPVFYRGQKIHQEGFRLDLLVENRVIVELKSVARLSELAQELECHPRTLYRDLEAIQVAGFPIYTEKVDGY